MKRNIFFASLASLLCIGAYASAEWNINKDNTTALLQLTDNYTPNRWILGEGDGMLDFDLNDLETSYLELAFPMENLYTGSSDWDKVAKKELFDSKSELLIFSDKIELLEDSDESEDPGRRLLVSANLELNGVSKPIQFVVTIVGLTIHDDYPEKFLLVFDIDFDVRFSDFQLGLPAEFEDFKDEFSVDITIEAQRNKR